MRRRDFITLLGGAAAVWPGAARAQQPGRLPTIGFLGTTDPSTMRPWITAFVERLRDLGWIEDRTIAIAYRWAEGHPERHAVRSRASAAPAPCAAPPPTSAGRFCCGDRRAGSLALAAGRGRTSASRAAPTRAVRKRSRSTAAAANGLLPRR